MENPNELSDQPSNGKVFVISLFTATDIKLLLNLCLLGRKFDAGVGCVKNKLLKYFHFSVV